MKRKLTLLITLILVFSAFISPVTAADKSSSAQLVTVVSPENQTAMRYTYIDYAFSSLNISSSGLASAYNSISCNSSVNKIVISCYIQKYDNGWKTVSHWRDTTYSNRASSSHSAFVYHGYTYRVKTYFYAYVGSESESTSCSYSRYY